MLKANFHTHTTFCDGSDSPEAVAKYAFTGGMSHLGFSGHMDADIHMDWPSYVKEIRRLKDLYVGRMDIFLGVELDTLYDPGSICGEDGLPEAEYIIGSTHFLDVPSAVPMSVDSSPEQMEALCREFFEEDYYRLSKAYYDLESQVYARTGCTFVGHFDLPTKYNEWVLLYDTAAPAYRDAAFAAMEKLSAAGKIFEINSGAISRGWRTSPYPEPALLRHLRDIGGRICISSDAHDVNAIDCAFDRCEALARECGFEELWQFDGRDFAPVPLI